jgi:hypothetical protein
VTVHRSARRIRLRCHLAAVLIVAHGVALWAISAKPS